MGGISSPGRLASPTFDVRRSVQQAACSRLETGNWKLATALQATRVDPAGSGPAAEPVSRVCPPPNPLPSEWEGEKSGLRAPGTLASPVTDRRFTRFAIVTLGFNMAVILFGAVVRATGSGAGCGAHWPSCQGTVVPLSGSAETFVEFTHRASSGVALVLVAILAGWAIRRRPKGDAARRTAIASGILIVNEALIGAALVLFEWVADDQSIGRAVSIALHLTNTFLLLGALALTAWFASGHQTPRRPFEPATRRLLAIGAVALVVVGAAGAITALGDTLFPPESVGAGLRDDLTGVFLVRLRWIHPLLAVATAVYLLSILGRLRAPDWAASLLRALIIVQVTAGAINIGLLAPVWMQLVHLLLADAVWITFVIVGVAALSERARLEVSV